MWHSILLDTRIAAHNNMLVTVVCWGQGFALIWWCLMPLSTIFQVYHGIIPVLQPHATEDVNNGWTWCTAVKSGYIYLEHIIIIRNIYIKQVHYECQKILVCLLFGVKMLICIIYFVVCLFDGV